MDRGMESTMLLGVAQELPHAGTLSSTPGLGFRV